MDPRRKTEADEEEQASFLPHNPRDSEDAAASAADRSSTRRKTTTWYLRLLLDVAMAATIIFLLFFRSPSRDTIRRTPVPTRRISPLPRWLISTREAQQLERASNADSQRAL